MSELQGLPLLSGPPPPMESGEACRKCDKEFNMFLNRSRKCHHCGYSYCHSCTDYQALMPRPGLETGYNPMNVCAFCVEYLTITAAGKGHLRTMPLSKLRKYVDAYNIKTPRVVEKDDLIDKIITSRNSNGCLPRENESFYRKYSVPDRSTHHGGIFSRSSQTPPAPPPPRPPARPQSHSFPRPDLEPSPPRQHHPPNHPPHRHPQAPPPPRPWQQYQPPAVPPHNSRPRAPYQRPASSQAFTPRPPPPPAPRPRATSTAPPPTLDQLIEMPDPEIASLSISALKSILYTNHVNARMTLEKGDLVLKVKGLVEDEKRERQRQREAEEAEEAERIERQRVLMEQHNQAMREREERARAAEEEMARAAEQEIARAAEQERREAAESREEDRDAMEGVVKIESEEVKPSVVSDLSSSHPKQLPLPKNPERMGLCVICQDDEANIAIVDCGHLAMCRDCSELVMKGSRECPLCRTRIVTEARLLRIFRT